MSSPTKEPLWQTRVPHGLVWDIWEQDATVYDRFTGETHLLGPLPVELLQLLDNTPMTAEELAHRLGDLCEVDCTPAWKKRIARMLADLASLSLIEKKPE